MGGGTAASAETTAGISVWKRSFCQKANEISSGASDVTGGWSSGKSGVISRHLLLAGEKSCGLKLVAEPKWLEGELIGNVQQD